MWKVIFFIFYRSPAHFAGFYVKQNYFVALIASLVSRGRGGRLGKRGSREREINGEWAAYVLGK